MLLTGRCKENISSIQTANERLSPVHTGDNSATVPKTATIVVSVDSLR